MYKNTLTNYANIYLYKCIKCSSCGTQRALQFIKVLQCNLNGFKGFYNNIRRYDAHTLLLIMCQMTKYKARWGEYMLYTLISRGSSMVRVPSYTHPVYFRWLRKLRYLFQRNLDTWQTLVSYDMVVELWSTTPYTTYNDPTNTLVKLRRAAGHVCNKCYINV